MGLPFPMARGKVGGPGGHDHSCPSRHVLYCIVAATVLYTVHLVGAKLPKRASRHPGQGFLLGLHTSFTRFTPSSQLRAAFAVQPFAGDAP